MKAGSVAVTWFIFILNEFSLLRSLREDSEQTASFSHISIVFISGTQLSTLPGNYTAAAAVLVTVLSLCLP